MLANCDAGGVFDETPDYVSRVAGIPLDAVQRAVTMLEGVDGESRSPEEGGARIIRLDGHRTWGWRIVNYQKYRNSTGAERVAEHRWRQDVTRCNAELHDVTPGNQAEAEAEESTSTHLIDSDESNVSVSTPPDRKAVIEAILGGASVKSPDKAEWEEGFREDFWKTYPRKVGKPGALRAWHRLMPEKLAEQQETLDGICSGLSRWIDYWREHETPEDKIPHPATFLNDHRHEDFPS